MPELSNKRGRIVELIETCPADVVEKVYAILTEGPAVETAAPAETAKAPVKKGKAGAEGPTKETEAPPAE